MRTLTLIALAAIAKPVSATPSSIVWVNSVDAQAFGTVHLGVDNFVAMRAGAPPLAAAMGLTFGVSPLEWLRAEVGADFWANAPSPLWLNAKLATPEREWLPAFALGAYGVGVDAASAYHCAYLVAAKTVGPLGRFTLGGYAGLGAATLFGGPDLGRRAGLIAAWERTLAEISPDLWVAADVQTGLNAFGAASAGVAYKLGPAAAILVGYNHMFDPALPSTVYVALDADLTLFTLPSPQAVPPAEKLAAEPEGKRTAAR
jgi:hypothetical protein